MLQLALSDIPVVTIDYIFNDRLAVVSDNAKGMEDLFTYIYQMGHRRIAYIHGTDSAVTTNRLSSFYRTAEKFGVEIPDEYVMMTRYRDTKGAGEATEKLLDLRRPADLYFISGRFCSIGRHPCDPGTGNVYPGRYFHCRL